MLRSAFSLSVLLALTGCSGGGTEAPAAPVAVTPAPGPSFDFKADASKLNVIFISMDAMRFDRTGAGGASGTPHLDAFAKEAVVFTNTTAAAPWTVPSHMAMFTGRWPTHHGVVNKLKPNPAGGDLIFDSLKAEIPTFPEKLIDAGWKGVGFTGGAGVQAKFGYGRKFESYLDDKPFAGMEYSGPPAMEWLRAHKADHFFMFFHGYDAHGQHPLLDQDPRAAVPDYKGALDGGIVEQAALREKGLAAIQKPGDPAHLDGLSAEDIRFLTAIYDAKVKEADARLGLFLDTVKEQGLLDRSIVVILADHGEEFMEHGYLDHGATLCEHQLHVPMMIRFPEGIGHRTVDQAVRTIDVFPTLFDALGVALPADIDGKSLLPLLRGEKADLPIFAESDYRLFVHLRSAVQGTKKVVLDLEDGQRSLFDHATDKDELHDLSESDPKTTYEMEQSVRAWMASMNSDPQNFLGVEEQSIKLF
jgi:arylsulfatase A-like enzyme